MYSSEIIAKKIENKNITQSLIGHTTDALLIFKDLLEKNKDVIKNFCKNWNIDFNDFCNLCFLTIYIHDIGKATKQFQERIKNNEKCNSVSHAFFGLPFIESTFCQDKEYLNFILKSVILSHHTQLHTKIFDGNLFSGEMKYYENFIKQYIENCEILYNKYFTNEFKFRQNLIYIDKNLNTVTSIKFKELERLKRKINIEKRTKAIYSFILSILKHCDQQASANFEKISKILKEKDKPYNEMLFYELNSDEKKIKLDKINYDYKKVFNLSDSVILDADKKNNSIKPYGYQVKASNLKDSGIISAPCGRGKTEASLFGALNIMKEQHKNKIIFALPTQITSNYMCERLKKIFGNENVGLYHGMSRFVGKETPEKIEDENNEEFKFDVEDSASKVFGKPVVVTTIDHLLYSFVHGYKQADFALGNILNSIVIFDEIHYYDTHTLSYVLDGIELMHKLKIPNIIMSGTLPDFIVEKLKEKINLNEKEFKQKYELIEDEEGMKYQPFIVRKNEKTIMDNIDKIKEIYKQKKNQIIILNTVERTQEVYKKLNTIKKILLYHSQFNFEDRRYKERKINDEFKNSREPWIIVSTQAIEISVDISCDIMHTELAPADSIGQRGGRLNRGGKEHKNQFIMNIYEPEDYKPYCYGKDGERLIKNSEDIIHNGGVSYNSIKGWCNTIYDNIKIENSNLIYCFEKCILFGLSVKEVRGFSEEDNGNLVEIRKIDYSTVDILPFTILKDKGEKILNEKNLRVYLVKVPYWWLKNSINKELNHFEEEYNRYGRLIWICKIPYNNEIGFDLSKLDKTTATKLSDEKSCFIT